MSRWTIVSGGQTGVDRAALDAARAAGLPCAGFCPRGRRAEDGPIASRYPLVETPSEDPVQRTEWNVRDSDATLVLGSGAPTGGTAHAVAHARRLARPLLVHDLANGPLDVAAVRAWLARAGVARLNVAGPRESEAPGIGREARAALDALFAQLGPESAQLGPESAQLGLESAELGPESAQLGLESAELER